MHKSCWKRWTLQAGNVCIICRVPEPLYENGVQPIHIEPPIIRIEYKETINFIYMFQAFVLTLLFLAAVNQQAPLQIRLHDEL
jgi:hypothetical protein